MTPNEYQELAHEYATYGGNAMYPVLGLAEEAGEVAGKVAKFIRKHNGKQPMTAEEGIVNEMTFSHEDENTFREAISKELGDCLWMIAEIATIYGLSLKSIMKENIVKLADRKARGVIVGEGDNR